MKKAFTLIELLVVIAIIAILAAILFPVFAQAKMAAKKTSALSNIKQTSTGVMLYLADYDDTYPMGAGACWWYPTDGGWSLDTRPYIKNLPLLRTPDDPLDKNGWLGWLRSDPNGVPISFASNGLIRWNGSQNENFGLMTLVQNIPAAANRCGASPWMGNTIVNATSVGLPADTIMLATRYNSQITWGMGDMITGVDWWDGSGHGGLIPDGSRNGNPYTASNWDGQTFTINRNNRNGAVSAGYANKAVFAFADGHAAVLDPVQTNPNEGAQPQLNKWNAKRQ
jgi:prepilin-type N-terminal cleavage/methylation domain-containing protein/prepilin-type processing-associated H-X9-DG protein